MQQGTIASRSVDPFCLQTYLENAPLAQNANCQRTKWLHLSDDTISSLELAVTTTALANGKFAKQDWISAFENFWIGDLYNKRCKVRYENRKMPTVTMKLQNLYLLECWYSEYGFQNGLPT